MIMAAGRWHRLLVINIQDLKGGQMTADGEAFDPKGLNAAPKYLLLSAYVRVTSLENRRSSSFA